MSNDGDPNVPESVELDPPTVSVDPGDNRQPLHKRFWTMVAGVGVVLGIVTGVLTLWDRGKADDAGPSFEGEVNDEEGVAAFLNLAEDHEGNRVAIDLSCTYEEDGLCRTQDAIGGASRQELWLFTDGPCREDHPALCAGGHVFTITIDEGTGAQLGMGPAGAGSLILGGDFTIRNSGHGAYGPDTTGWDMTALAQR